MRKKKKLDNGLENKIMPWDVETMELKKKEKERKRASGPINDGCRFLSRFFEFLPFGANSSSNAIYEWR